MSQLFVNRLTIIDFSYLHPERGLLGESWLMDLELEGDLNDQGMVLDFGLIKKQVKQLIDNEFDHHLLVPAYHTHSEMEERDNETIVRFTYAGDRHFYHRSPSNAVCAIPAGDITLDTVSRAIHDRLEQELPENVHGITVRLYSELIAGASYHYSHGLKHHDGNCRRIAHGHRSRLQIFCNGERDDRQEWNWDERWHDIYLANREDLRTEHNFDGVDYYRFAYQTVEGLFEMELPSADCYLIDTDTTVENLAEHITGKLHKADPDSQYVVLAYEGVDKGAIGRTVPDEI